jgi:hypothetical protein
MTSLGGLLSLFRRPTGSADFQFYGKPEQLELTAKDEHPSIPHDWTRRVLAALYGKPKNRIVVGDPGSEADRTVLALWSQQWPRLRRSFRFCTFAPSDRSIEGAAFDLQVLPALDRGVRSRFVNAVDAEMTEKDLTPWIEDAIHDLLHPDVDGLRSFLRRLGSDVAGGRDAFRPLCQLHQLVAQIGFQPEAMHDAIATIDDNLGPNEAGTARAVVANAALQRAEDLDDRSFDFLWRQLSFLESGALRAHAGAVGRAAWRRDPSMLLSASIDAPLSELLIDSTLDSLSASEVMDGLRAVPTLAERALSRRHELVELPDFWRHSDQLEQALQIASKSGRQRATIKAILASGRDDLAPRAVTAFGARETLTVLKGVQDPYLLPAAAWLRSAANDTNAVADFLTGENGIYRALLVALARLLPPDAIPNDYGPDSWVTAWRHSSGVLEENDSVYIAAYFLARALGFRSRSQAELAQVGFEMVHRAAEGSVLSEEAWRLVEPRLPWSDFWFSWDRCQRLRAGVIALFVDRDLSPGTFANLVGDNELFAALAKSAARTGRGRAYLKRVEHSVRESNGQEAGERLLTIERLVD